LNGASVLKNYLQSSFEFFRLVNLKRIQQLQECVNIIETMLPELLASQRLCCGGNQQNINEEECNND